MSGGGARGPAPPSRLRGAVHALEKLGRHALARSLALFLSRRRLTADEVGRLEVRRLLVVRQHHQMGDMLLAVPAYRALRARFPAARITLVASRLNAPAVRGNPYVDEVLVLPKGRGPSRLRDLARFVADLRGRDFDLAIVLHTGSFSVTSMLLSVASGARVRIGSTSRPFGHDLTSRFYHLELPLPSPAELETLHESAHNLYPLAAIGARTDDLTSVFVPAPEDERECERFLADAFGATGRFLLVHPGAAKPANVWPGERFAEAARLLAAELGCGVVAAAGPADAETLAAFLAACGTPPVVRSSMTLGFLGALARRSLVTLCNDTGVMHVAAAVGARCVAVFGPTDPARWKPVSETLVAVRGKDGTVESVGVPEVVAAARGLLGR